MVNLEDIKIKSFVEELTGEDEAHIGSTYLYGVRGIKIQQIIEHLDGTSMSQKLVNEIVNNLRTYATDEEFTNDEKTILYQIAKSINDSYDSKRCRIPEITRFELSSKLNRIVHEKKDTSEKSSRPVARKIGQTKSHDDIMCQQAYDDLIKKIESVAYSIEELEDGSKRYLIKLTSSNVNTKEDNTTTEITIKQINDLSKMIKNVIFYKSIHKNIMMAIIIAIVCFIMIIGVLVLSK